MRFEKSQRAVLAGFLAIAAWLFFFAGEGLNAFFSPDDVMNLQALHGLWDKPLWRIAYGLVNPLTGDYRPLGGLFYRIFWAAFGFNPLPYRIACFLLLLTNLGLAWLLLRRHARCWPAVVAGMLLCAYHPEAPDLYFNSGTIYDLLAACFFLLALLRAGDAPAWQTAALTWLAIQSKEMAATLPLILFFYVWGVEGKRRVAPILASGLVVALVLGIKLTAGQGLVGNALYRPRFELPFILDQYAKYHGDLVAAQAPAALGWMLTFWFLLLLAYTSLKNRVLLFGLLFWLVTLIPVAVIPARSAFVLHLPLVGLALILAVLIARIPRRTPQWLCLAVVIVLVGGFNLHHRSRTHAQHLRANLESRQLTSQLKSHFPQLPPRAHLLFLSDPYPPHDWVLTFFVRLLYNDPSILIDRAKDGGSIELPSGTIVLAFQNLRLKANPPVSGALGNEVVRFTPDKVRPGQAYEVQVGQLRATTVDVEYTSDTTGIETSGRIIAWCTLDAGGKARLVTPVGQPPGLIRLRRIRASGDLWLEVEASLTVLP